MDTRNQSSNVNYLLDGYIAGYDASFFKTITGTAPVTALGLIPFNSNVCTSKSFFKYGDFEFTMVLPAVPTAGDVRKWGLVSPALGDKGAIFFAVTDDELSVNVYDNDGDALLTQVITFTAAWATKEVSYRIKWDRDVVEFWIDGTRVASYRVDPTIQHTLSTYALPIYINNTNADDMALRSLAIRDARFVQAPSQMGSGTDVTVTADTEFPAASALSDADANPTTTRVGANMLLWDGVQWRRATSADFGSGGSAGGGNNTYSTEQGDFTATPTDATNDIVLNVDSIGGVALAENNFANGILKVYQASTEEVKTITLDDFTWTSATKTLNTANCAGAFTFATGDLVSLTIPGPRIQDDRSSDAKKSVEQNPVYNRHVGDTLAALTNIATNTTGYLYLSMDGYKFGGFQCVTSGTTPTDTLTLTLEGTMQDDGTADSSCNYDDITSIYTGSASFTDQDLMIILDQALPFKYLRLKYVTSNGGGNDADLTVYARRTY